MTLKTRNNLFIAGLVAGGLMALLYSTGVIYLLLEHPDKLSVEMLFLQSSSKAVQSIVPLLLLNIFLFTSELVLFITFRKTSSAEIFFFFLFLLATGCEGFRLGLIYIDWFELPFRLGMSLSRILYFGRFLGTLALFSAGLFSCGIPYQRVEIVMGGIILIALALATTIPLESGLRGDDLLFLNGLQKDFFWALLIVEVLGVGNLLYAVYHHGNRNYYFLAIGLACIIVSKGLIFHIGGIIFYSIGYLGLILGAILFGRKTHDVYLWS